ncbi:MAG TPA: hypothetical protein VF870_00765 [Ignavibacteriaceae bacterium]
MKNSLFALLIFSISFLTFPVFSQTGSDTTSLGLPGDNLDLFAVLDLFQKSKTIEDFEKSLNEEKTGINNLDLNLDNKVDFIKVVTKQDGNDFTFILQVDVTEKETQDVAVILVSKDKNDKVTMQIVGDVDLYGKDYVIEPKPPVTPNPGYVENKTDTVKVSSPTTVVVVEQTPIVQYVYSPVYVPYYPPYHYAYYPPYFAAFTVVAIGVYRSNHYYYHAPYHGGYGNTVVIHNSYNYNNYNNYRNRSNTVNHYNSNGNYNRNNVSNNRNNVSNNKNNVSNNKGNVSNNKSKGTSTTTNRPTTTNQTKTPSTTTRKQTSTNQSMNSSRSRSGGNYSSGSSRGGGGGRRR